MTQLLLFEFVCTGCRRKTAGYRRGMCHRCWKASGPIIRPPQGKKVPEPTTARPGTAEKLEVLRRRRLNGEMLFHPDDQR